MSRSMVNAQMNKHSMMQIYHINKPKEKVTFDPSIMIRQQRMIYPQKDWQSWEKRLKGVFEKWKKGAGWNRIKLHGLSSVSIKLVLALPIDDIDRSDLDRRKMSRNRIQIWLGFCL